MNLNGAEIFSVGKWNGMEFTDDDLREIEASFERLSLAGRVPLKFGHNSEQEITDGQPALGWVSRVWRDGGKLFADFVNIPKLVYDAIRDKLYNFVSVELLQDAEQDGASYPWVLGAVSLLGADRPAVKNLQELSRLTMSRRAVLEFARAGQLHFTGDGKSMADDTEALRDQLKALQAQVQTFDEKEKALIAERDKLISDRKKEKAAAIKEQVTQKFEDAIERKIILPSARERFFKWMFTDDVDELLEKFDMSEVDSFITENRTNMSDDPTPRRKAKEDEEGKTPDVIVAQRTRIVMSENDSMDYKAAMLEVLREDPQLADEYRFMPDKHYK